MSVEFFGFPKIGQTGTVTNTNSSETAGKSGAIDGTTSTSFSSALEGASQAQTDSVASSERAARVEELKTQVAEGSYEPDLSKVASSLLKFLVEE